MKRTRIDWEAVRNRLSAGERMLEDALAESPERIRTAYHRRAIQLAQMPVEQRPALASLPFLIFRLAQERYAVELAEIAETVVLPHCTPIPGAPAQFRGVMNLRGEIRPVVDLGGLFGFSKADPPEPSAAEQKYFALILRRPGRQICLQVDGLDNVREIRQEEIFVSGQGKYTKGIASGVLNLLNLDAILAEVFSKEESIACS